jgi:DNA repair exonuclease SbcCD ATPase subunit
MKLSSNNRRDVIEDILDIDIFSIMNTLLKERSSVLKTDMSQNDYDIKSLESGIEMKEEYIEKLKGSKQDRVESIRNNIQDCKNTICDLQLQIDTKMREIDSISIGDICKLNSDLEERVDIFKKMKNNKDRLKKENKFFTENDHCNTCHQDIDEKLSTEIISNNQKKISDLDSAFVDIQKMISSVNDSIKAEQDKVDAVNKINTEILNLNQEIGFQNKSIEKYEKEIEFLKSKNDIIDGEYESLNKMKEQLEESNQSKNELLERNQIYNICGMLLKDTGIKTRIIKQYLPIMNKLINGYLNDFDFFANFNLDENFSEVIKSRHRDEFSYDSFSEGEKQRIDLAILFTWREVARMKNSVNTNLLILDEVFDSSLDAEGTENFMKVMNSLEGKGLNTFVISHKTDLLADKFDKQIKFEKIGNFSHKK